MRFSQEHLSVIEAQSRTHGFEPAILMGVIELESGGQIFADVNGTPMPLIRFEGHYFDQRLTGKQRDLARSMGLADPRAGVIKNPRSQAARYDMLARAMDINAQAAMESISIGFGQVMGSHWQWLGYPSVQAMFARAREGFAGQLELMMRYIERAGLVDELQRFDWAGFARGYNGPGYARNGYHTKLKAAYERHSGKASPTSPASGMLRLGSKGARVRELQQLLTRAGHHLKVDGDFGPATKHAVKEFQAEHNLQVDGVAGPRTMAALSAYRTDPEEALGTVGPLETPEGRSGAGSSVVGVGLTVAAEKIDEVASKIGLGGVQWFDQIASGLYVLSGVLVLGGLAWAAYGYLKSQRTYEGTS